MTITADHTRLITGSTDSEVRVWAIVDAADADPGQLEASQAAEGVPVIFVPLGAVTRQSRERVIGLHLGCGGSMLACQAVDKAVEFFRFRTEPEIAKRLKRREKRAKAKAEDDGAGAAVASAERTLDDEIFSCGVMRCGAKVRALCFDPYSTNDGTPKGSITVALSNNTLETYSIDGSAKSLDYDKLSDQSFAGHRTPLRAVAMCENDALILSTSNKGAKVWDVKSRKCIRTLDGGYGLCCMFVPGSRHAVVGTRSGELLLFELSSGRLIEKVGAAVWMSMVSEINSFASRHWQIEEAHDGAIWSMDLQPDKHGFVTGGADKSVNIWEFELVADEENEGLSKRLSCAHLKALKMTDDVLSVKFSPDQRFLAVALLDSTVKVSSCSRLCPLLSRTL